MITPRMRPYSRSPDPDGIGDGIGTELAVMPAFHAAPMADTPRPTLALVRQGMKQAADKQRLESGNVFGIPPELIAMADKPIDPLPTELDPSDEQATEASLFDAFRSHMRRAGLVPYEVTDTMLGADYHGPAVNVIDPAHARLSTDLVLATHGVSGGIFRMYPVLAPIDLQDAPRL